MSTSSHRLSGELSPLPPGPPAGHTVSILGVSIANYTFEEGILCLSAMIRRRTPSRLFFGHWHTLNMAAKDSAFRNTLNQADVVFGDGTGVRWAARARGVALKGNLNGTDMIPALLRSLSLKDNRYFLLGARPHAIERAAAFARTAFPGWVLAGHHHGYLDSVDPDDLVKSINAAEINLLLVGMGSPWQERWILRNQHRLNPCCCVSVGGLFDHWSGELRRAPKWLRQRGAEWLYLPFQQRRKFQRYFFESLVFLWRMWRAAPAEIRSRPGKSYGLPGECH